MLRAFRWLMRLFVGLAVVTGLAAGLVWYLASRSLPDYSATLAVAGISGPVEIVRDAHAVPHVFADDPADVFFGLGYAHAQDRLWQMTLMRRTAQGRLSALFGPATLEIDRLMRALDLYRLAQIAAEDQTAETTRHLRAYAAGINARIAEVRDGALGRGAPEFFLFPAQIAPWTPADSIAVQKLMALQLTDKAQMETLRARLSLVLPPERLADVLPDAPGPAIAALPDFATLFPDAPGVLAPATDHALYPIAPVGRAGASNAFAAAAHRAAGGAPLLASDPHLPLSAPSIWYLARLEFPEGGVIGGTIPGIPAVLIGRNPHLAWGLTSSYLDDQDIFIERLHPDDPERYETPEGWARFRVRDVVVEVAGETGQTMRFLETENGPVIPPGHFGVEAVTPPGHVASLGWTALAERDRSIAAAMGIMRARSVAEARAAGRDHLAPSLNLMLADRDGIAMQTIGAIPRRDPGHTSQGRIPAPGWLARNRWQGTLPYEDNPAVVDPPSGLIANTNNRIVDAPFPDHFSHDWGDAYRIIRAERLLSGREFHTLDSFIEAQTDIVAETARAVLPLIARDLWFADDPAAEDAASRRRATALALLADWTGEMSAHGPEPLIYTAWMRALQRRLAVDELGALVASLPPKNPLFIERVFRDTDGAAAWCNIRQSTRTETCSEMARLALDEALVELVAAHGPRVESWRWGDAHQALHLHQTLDSVPILRWLVNIRQETPGGDNTLLRGQIRGHGPAPYSNVHAAGLRGVFDFADPESSVIIIATGQSGHPLSRHYDDLAGPWRRSEYIPMRLDPDLARSGARGITRLEPAPD